MDSTIPNIQTTADGADVMSFIFQNLKIQIKVNSEERTGQRTNRKQGRSGLTRMIQSYHRLIRSPMLVTAKQFRAGEQSFSMILLHEYYGQRKHIMNAIILPFRN